MTCTKRQRVVRRGPEGQEESFRCLNRACDLHSQAVTDGVCDACPFTVLKHVKPCTKIPAPCVECREKEREMMAKQVPTPEFPSLMVQLITWKEAVRKWRAAGRPNRTDEQVAEIKNKFCNKVNCSWFDPEKNRCKGCGCKVTNGGVAVLNKIRMATEHCPREMW